ncbi:7,8-dihydro-8-oxoguanine triphosphatase-like [Amphibalanus amphitrite]|uniref:7,8-dihydro-8-oxoguanine triphosphatase-like n=1 Tax=Amphibalanus amphitrite TaxID=1232801 RepID=UPI001C91571F|nr:7,8-dihydro-8-oxoguanine triphosphatase-like [Amphibalanus amphitrite]XP_043222331.1 7,8-dihydro-8-oxoguanine triphosphatase-like [Amphibalanus amphitrite]XP_043222332.1 7,8-dihydro-8-oxoguanine triphosphatase-like [Amphibalanus amphitrite]
MLKKVLTLVLVRDVAQQRVLLGMKKRGFGAGKWNGFGGKLEPGETVEEAAKRELLEESCVHAEELLPAGRIEFEFQGDPCLLDVHVFTVEKYKGSPHETEEMRPLWYEEGEIPFDKMWADDRFWFPLMLEKKLFKARFLFKGHETILDQSLQVVDAL